jgi:hypothetical protein
MLTNRSNSMSDPKPVLDNTSKQLNDHDPAFHRARGASPEEAERLAEAARRRDKEGKK